LAREGSNTKKALIIITKPPYTFEHPLGGLYTALALVDEGVEASLLLMEDGVYCALQEQKGGKVSFEDLLYTARSSDVEVLVFGGSLRERGLTKEMLNEVCKVVDDLDGVIEGCDHVLYY
jgi:sulfur relay (sulfurtransferase) DsrF/TusC family protein